MVQFLAFSLQDQVEKYGAYVGIAAFFGLAVLTILYFSQARELRRLRDWAGRAPERAQELEARAVANADAVRRVQAQPIRSAAPSAAAVAAATAAGSRAGGGTAQGGGEQATQVADAVEDAGAAQAGNGTAGAAERAGEPPSEETSQPAEGEKAASAGDEAAAPDQPGEPAPNGEEKPADEAPAPTDDQPGEAAGPEPAAAAARDAGEDEAEEAAEDDEPAAERASEPTRPGEIPPAPVPRATPLPRRAPAPSPAAPLRQPSRSTTLPPRRPAPAAARRQPNGGGASRTSRAALIGVGVGVIVLAAVALVATGVIGGGDDNGTAPPPNTTSQPSAQTPEAGALTPATTKVAVLNGTTTAGLASDAADTIRGAGYEGEVTTGNNTDQARAESEVLYGTKAGARRQASSISRRLEIDTIGRLDADTRNLSENADVVVILGQDKAP